MKFNIAIFFLFCFFLSANGQLVSELPEYESDIDVHNLKEKNFCQPGVQNKSRSKGLAIRYGYLGSGSLNSETDETGNSNNEFSKYENLEIKIKIPIIVKENLKVLIGYKFYQEGFDFTEIGSTNFTAISDININSIKQSSFSLIVNKSLNERNYLALQLRYTLSGNFSGVGSFKNRFAAYRVLGVYGIKPNEDFEWGIALSVSQSFRRFNVIPFVLLYKNFSPKWGFEALLPGFAFMRYNASPQDILLGGLQFGNKNFRLQIPEEGTEGLDFAYSRSNLKAAIKYQRRIIPWLWTSLQVGYQYNFNSRFEAQNDITPEFDLRLSNTPYIQVGLFVSPHKKVDKLMQSVK